MATYEDVLAAPDNMTAELIDGRLRLQAQPAPTHQFTAGRIALRLGMTYENGIGGPGGWLFAPEPEVWIGNDMLVPDLAGWRVETMPQLPSDWTRAPRPDWICEILSPSTAWKDRHEKAPLYALHGVSFLWLVEPRDALIEAFENQNNEWTALSGPPCAPFLEVPAPLA